MRMHAARLTSPAYSADRCGNTPASQNHWNTSTTMPPGLSAPCRRSRTAAGCAQRSRKPAHSMQSNGSRTVSRNVQASAWPQ